MTRWRKRIGAERLETLLTDTLAIALDSGATKPKATERVTIDTTVRTKTIAYPTDGHLMLRAIERVTDLAREQGVTLRQSYARVARHARRGCSMAAVTSRACAGCASCAHTSAG